MSEELNRLTSSNMPGICDYFLLNQEIQKVSWHKMGDMNFKWEAFLTRHRAGIVHEWQQRLKKDVSLNYAQRPVEELTMTVGKACDAFCRVMTDNDYTLINEFINEITQIRLEAGFPLDDVQKAFELYRQIVIPLLVQESPPQLICENIQSVNVCLAYTIHRFSHHFQKKHEKYLKDYAGHLEKEVAERTVELRESEHKYKTLVEDISDGYLVLDKERVAFVNPAFCRMHGCRGKDTLHKSFLAFVAEESRDRVRGIICREVKKGTEPDAFEYLRVTQEGKTLPTEMNFRPSRFQGRDYFLCIVRDITKRVEMEKKSRETERMAYIGQLTASLSHEIRNPLSSVKMNLQILSKNIMLTGNDRKRLQISETEINRLESILKELLDFAKPLSLQLARTDINQVVKACVELLEIKFYRKSIDYQVLVDPGVTEVFADKGKIEQMIINLLLNALDSVEDFGNIRILTRRKKHKGIVYALVRVEDNGKGIPKEALPHIFEPFYTTKATGTGFGLNNVKQIVMAHQGTVKVMNLKGSGTAFEVMLPLGETHG